MAKILVVDDSMFQVKTIASILTKQGHEVKTLLKSTEVISELQTTSYNYLISDLLMPGLDGENLTKQIRAEGLEIPIIILSANIQNKVKERCLSLGVNEFVNKPPTSENLENAIKTVGLG